MAEPFIAQISCFACSFSPSSWAYCNGQTLPIAQYTALYSIIGTIYGGDGQQTFLLPNLQGQSPMHWGTGPGGFNTTIGEAQGAPMITLITSQIPSHTHTITAGSSPSGGSAERSPSPSSTSFLSASAVPSWAYQKAPSNTSAQFSSRAIGVVGGTQPHENRQPYQALNICIALEGIYPQRN